VLENWEVIGVDGSIVYFAYSEPAISHRCSLQISSEKSTHVARFRA
jgi:hypothetical protein